MNSIHVQAIGEFCAKYKIELQYLKTDRLNLNNLTNRRDNIEKWIRYIGVARRSLLAHRLQFLDAVVEWYQNDNIKFIPSIVDSLADIIAPAWLANGANPSLYSKIAFLKFPSNIILYDRHSKKALGYGETEVIGYQDFFENLRQPNVQQILEIDNELLHQLTNNAEIIEQDLNIQAFFDEQDIVALRTCRLQDKLLWCIGKSGQTVTQFLNPHNRN
ncbi:MAG: hypothetical protein K2X37_00070 [Chitinophagaceae bacterium]|nr:hypothetical protein [Chitinophagaceae bacterium]